MIVTSAGPISQFYIGAGFATTAMISLIAYYSIYSPFYDAYQAFYTNKNVGRYGDGLQLIHIELTCEVAEVAIVTEHCYDERYLYLMNIQRGI